MHMQRALLDCWPITHNALGQVTWLELMQIIQTGREMLYSLFNTLYFIACMQYQYHITHNLENLCSSICGNSQLLNYELNYRIFNSYQNLIYHMQSNGMQYILSIVCCHHIPSYLMIAYISFIFLRIFLIRLEQQLETCTLFISKLIIVQSREKIKLIIMFW